MCDCRLCLWYTFNSEPEDGTAESLGRFLGCSVLLVFHFLWDVTWVCLTSQAQTHLTPLLWASSGQRIRHKEEPHSQFQSLCMTVVSPRRSWESWCSLQQKRLGGQPINVTHSQGLLLHSVPYGSSSSLLPPILQCIPALTMILSLQAPLPWSPSWPAPSLLEHEQGGFLLHHLQVWQRKSPQQVRETHTHSLLLLTETTPSSAYGVCRGVVGLSPLHKEAAKGENSEAFSSMNSMLPLLSTWTITFDFSRALYVAQFM